MSTRMKNSTVIKEEIDKFSRMSEEWWDPNGKFKPLHKFNPIRVKYIIDNTLSHFKINKKSDPLNGLNILDVGCGGGLLTEPLSRLGANVIGIDASKNNIEVAKRHLQKGNLKIYWYPYAKNFVARVPARVPARVVRAPWGPGGCSNCFFL